MNLQWKQQGEAFITASSKVNNRC